MAMGCKYVLAHHQFPFLFFGQLMRLALNPCLSCTDYLCTVDIKFEDVIVRELYPQVFFEVFGSERHSAAHIDVTVGVGPRVVHIGIFALCAPGSLLLFPIAVVERARSPIGIILLRVTNTTCP